MDATNPSGFTDALRKTLDAARQVQDIQDQQAIHDPVEVDVCDGQVTVRAKQPGTVELTIQPVAMRMGSEVLAGEIQHAVNEALKQLRETVGAAAAVDLEGVTESLAELQQQSAKDLGRFLDGIFAAQAKAAESDGK